MAPKKTRKTDYKKKTSTGSRKTNAEKKQEADKKKREKAVELLRSNPIAEPPGERGDGNLHVAFVSMGQGDCTLISTPKGKVVMIDCGSTAWDELDLAGMRDSGPYQNDARKADGRSVVTVTSVVRGKKFLRSADLDLLVLTHGDQDHYNCVGDVLEKKKIACVHHSGDISGFGTALEEAIAGAACIYRTTVNDDPTTVAGQDENGNPVQKARPSRIPGRSEANLHHGTAPKANSGLLPKVLGDGTIRIFEESGCTITVLASGVCEEYMKDKADKEGKNRGSMVLLVEAGREKLLLSGDATLNTEKYLMNMREAAISSATIVHASHHGSATTSSAQAFVDKLEPEQVRISAGRRIAAFHLPSRTVIARYQANLANRHMPVDGEPKHDVWSWNGAPGSWECDAPIPTALPLFTTGSQGTTFHTVDLGGGGGR